MTWAHYYPNGQRDIKTEIKWEIEQGSGSVSEGVFQAISTKKNVRTYLKGVYTENDEEFISRLNIVTSGTEPSNASDDSKKRLVGFKGNQKEFTVNVGETFDLTDLSGTATFNIYDDEGVFTETIEETVNGSEFEWYHSYNHNKDGGSIVGTNFTPFAYAEYSFYPNAITTSVRLEYTHEETTLSDLVTGNIKSGTTKISIIPSEVTMYAGEIISILDYRIIAQYDDETTKELSFVTGKWELSQGEGIFLLSNSVYQAPEETGNATLKTIYKFNGEDITCDLAVTITSDDLASIKINPVQATVSSGDYINLDNIAIEASYIDDTKFNIRKIMANKSGSIKYSMKSGAGTVSLNTSDPFYYKYNAPVEEGDAVIEVSYTEDGITKTADLIVKILPRLLRSVSNPDDLKIKTSQVINLSLVKITGYYDNDTTGIIRSGVNWSIVSGGGILNGNEYTAPVSEGTVILNLACTERNITKTAQLKLIVEKDSGSATVVDGMYTVIQKMTKLNGMDMPNGETDEVKIMISGTNLYYNYNPEDDARQINCIFDGTEFSGTKDIPNLETGTISVTINGDYSLPFLLDGTMDMKLIVQGNDYFQNYEFSGSKDEL